MRRTYHHGEHGIRGLEAIGALFPEITIPLDGDDVAANVVSGLCDDDVGNNIGMLGGEGLSDAEAADSAANDNAVHRAGLPSVCLPGGGGGRRDRGFLLSDGAANAGSSARKREEDRSGGSGETRWAEKKRTLGAKEGRKVGQGAHGARSQY